MLVTVAVPAYNQAEYLRLALQSALAQSHADLEVVVVDDGSTDHTRDVCASFSDARVRYLHQQNDGTRGIGARNRAVLEARGEAVALLDQDDLWHPRKIEAQVARLARSPECGAVFCLAEIIDADSAVVGRQDADVPEGWVYASLLEENRYYASTALVRRSALAVSGLPPADAGSADWYQWLLVARHFPVGVVREHLAQYRQHASSYQNLQRRQDLRRLATDRRKVLDAQRHRLPHDCADCRAALRRGLDVTARRFLDSAIAFALEGRLREASRDVAAAAKNGNALTLFFRIPRALLRTAALWLRGR